MLVLLNSLWISAHNYDDIKFLDTIWSTDKRLLHFELSKSDQILRVDKTGFPRPGHILQKSISRAILLLWQ